MWLVNLRREASCMVSYGRISLLATAFDTDGMKSEILRVRVLVPRAGTNGVCMLSGEHMLQTLVVTPIQLLLPGDSRYMRLARLMASGVATTCGLSLEAVQDFRIAVDELCATLMEVGAGQPVRLVFSTEGDSLVVRGDTDLNADARAPDEDRLALSHHILDGLTDAHEFTRSDGSAVFTIIVPCR